MRLHDDLKDVSDVWIDYARLLGGSDWDHEINIAIASADYFIALISKHSLSKTGYVQKELRKALSKCDELPDGTIYLIPVRLDECQPVNHIIVRLTWIDMFPRWSDGMNSIRSVISASSPINKNRDKISSMAKSIDQLETPQLVRWAPNDGENAGIIVWNDNSDNKKYFIEWNELIANLEKRLLPKLFSKDHMRYSFRKADFHGKKDWLVQIFDDSDNFVCDVWFGGDPNEGWAFDGMIRFGNADRQPHVWQTYQRFSDGSYRRLKSLFRSIDYAIQQQALPE